MLENEIDVYGKGREDRKISVFHSDVYYLSLIELSSSFKFKNIKTGVCDMSTSRFKAYMSYIPIKKYFFV